MCQIELKGLHFKRFRLWLQRAKERQGKDSIDAFICAWIAFNHYYSTYCGRDEETDALYAHATLAKGKYVSDFNQLLFLCDQSDFKACYYAFRKDRGDLFKQAILLPVDKMETIRKSPTSRKRLTSLETAPPKRIIMTLSDIRTNLFHGYKDPDDERDMSLCHWAASILIPFLEFLDSNTTGEVKNVYERESPAVPLGPQTKE